MVLRLDEIVSGGSHRFSGNATVANFGSSHFLFERRRCSDRLRSFMVLSCPCFYYRVL